MFVAIYQMCTHTLCMHVFHYSSSFLLNHASRQEKLKPSPLGQYLWQRVLRYFQTQKSALNFKWDSRVGLKRRRSKSVEGFTLLLLLLLLLCLFSLSLSLLSTFSKSIYILTLGCRGMLSCCYAT